MIFIDMGNKSLIEYLNIDEFSYIENNKIKYRLTEEQMSQQFLTWEEGWKRVRMIIERVKEYDNSSTNEHMG